MYIDTYHIKITYMILILNVFVNSIYIICISYSTGLLYVVDSNDRERAVESREELFGILEDDDMRGVPVIVIANKQDLPSKFNLQLNIIFKYVS